MPDSENSPSELEMMLTGGLPSAGEDSSLPEAPTETDQPFVPFDNSQNTGVQEDFQEPANDDFIMDEVENNQETEVPAEHSADYYKGQLAALQNQGQQPGQLTQEQLVAIQAGEQLLTFQKNNGTVYNEMIQFAQNKMQGGQQAQPQAQAPGMSAEIQAFEDLIASEAYNGVDTKPMKAIVAAMKAGNIQTQAQLQQTIQAANSAINRVTSLEAANTKASNNKQAAVVDQQVADYTKATEDFGVKIKPDSKSFNKMTALVNAGWSVREAYLDTVGKTEADVREKPKGKRQPTSNKRGKKPTPGLANNRDQLADTLFGKRMKAKDLFTQQK